MRHTAHLAPCEGPLVLELGPRLDPGLALQPLSLRNPLSPTLAPTLAKKN